MSKKVMVFIDGSWLFHNLSHLREIFQDPNYVIDYKKLPKIIAKHIEDETGNIADIVRTHFFGAMPINKPGFDPTPQQNFFTFLERECHYVMEIHDIDFKHNLDIRPEEKCVDVALATSMMMYGAMPDIYDIAVLVAGDLDYMPLLRKVRMVGKRTMLVAMRSFADYSPSNDKLINDYTLYDYNVMYIDDYLEELRLVREKKLRTCKSCGEKKFTFWEGDPFYCPNCLRDYAEKNKPMTRACTACGAESETSWKGEVFYCDECRDKYRTGRW
ncbi:MAG: NYN domain-containing protein [Firmicutes bacterium]|nr:NYN domain-containing protein [Bacillota bacterium]